MIGIAQAEGVQRLERMRAQVAAMPAELPSGVKVFYTVSIGAAQRQAGEDSMALLERIDAALYAAKHRGRNRVVWAEFRSSPSLARARSRTSPAQPGEMADCTIRSSSRQTAM